MGDGALIFVLLVPVVALYLFVIRPAQARSRQALQVAESLKPGDEVMTTSGLFGTIVAVDADSVELQVSQGVVVRFARRAIGQVQVNDPPPPDGADDT